MSRFKDLSCWEIMNCSDDSACVARQNEDRACWDLAGEYKDLQNALGVCRDCIVYQVKKDPPGLDDDELAAIMTQRQNCVLNRSKRVSISADFSGIAKERRRVERFKINGESPTLRLRPYPHHRSNPPPANQSLLKLIDISKSGLAFASLDAWQGKENLLLDIEFNGYQLKKMPGILIPHQDEPGHCGVRFANLSDPQRTALGYMLMECG